MSADEKRDSRAHRLAWLLALALSIPILGTVAIVAFWPLPSPTPYRQRAIALMTQGRSADDLTTARETAQALALLSNDIRAIDTQVVADYTAIHGNPIPYSNGVARQWRVDVSTLYAQRPERDIERSANQELAREALRKYAEQDILHRIDTVAQAPFLYLTPDPSQPVDTLTLLTARGAIRTLVQICAARLQRAADAQDPAAARAALHTVLKLSELSASDKNLAGCLVAISCIDTILHRTSDYAVNPDANAELLRNLLDELNANPLLPSFLDMIRVSRSATTEALIIEFRKTSPIARLKLFAERQPSPHAVLRGLAATYDALEAIATSTDPHAQPDLTRVPTHQIPGPGASLTLHDHVTALNGARIHLLAAQTRFDAARILLAIALHDREVGRLPRTLAELAPTYLPTVPEDPFAPDHQFRYRILEPREANKKHARFTLYSVGFDATDDNANSEAEPIIASSPHAPAHTDAVFHPTPTRPH